MRPASPHIGRWVRTAWDMLGITLIVVLVVELGARALLRSIQPRATAADPRANADVYVGETWPSDYFQEEAELRAMWQPYTYWRMAPFQGRFIQVSEQGHRRTVLPESAAVDGDQPQVFMFGGSTMWGSGSRDSHTIPSQLALSLHDLGIDADIVNFGEIGYVSTQEVVALLLELRAGNVPDIVVFYDGINDVSSAFQSGEAGIPHNEYRRRAEFNILSRHRAGDFDRTFLQRWTERSATLRIARVMYRRMTTKSEAASGPDSGTVPLELVSEVAEKYLKNVQVVQMLAEDYGFTALFYWQPVIFQKRAVTPYEREQLARAEKYRGFFESCYAAVSQQAADVPGFRDISRILDGREEPCFLDFMHIGEQANGIVAAEMASDIIGILTQQPATGRPGALR